jgi:uncharacterized peroxidase-related enzyme
MVWVRCRNRSTAKDESERTMSRLLTPMPDVAPVAARPLLDAVKAQLGVVPNLYKVLANSPAALEGVLGLGGALGKGELDVRTRNRIAIAVAEANGCDYCLSAHTYLGKTLVKLSDAEVEANRSGRSSDPMAEAALRFAMALVQARGQVGDAEMQAVKAAGYSDAQVVEIIAHVALNTLTNYLNVAAKTELDFPLVSHRPR